MKAGRSSIRVEVGLKQRLRLLHVARPSAQESTEKAAAVEESGKSKKVDASDVGLKTRDRVTRTTKEKISPSASPAREGRPAFEILEQGWGARVRVATWCIRRRRREESRPQSQFLSRDACGRVESCRQKREENMAKRRTPLPLMAFAPFDTSNLQILE